MAGPRLFMEMVSDPPQEHPDWVTTKFLWRPSFYVLMGTPSAEGSFEVKPNDNGGYDSDCVRIPIDEARSHFARQYEKLFRWVFESRGAYDRLSKSAATDSQEWQVLRRILNLFGSDDYLEVLRELAKGGLVEVTFDLDLDTSREDVKAAYLEAERGRYELTKTYNHILNLLGEGGSRCADVRAVYSGHRPR